MTNALPDLPPVAVAALPAIEKWLEEVSRNCSQDTQDGLLSAARMLRRKRTEKALAGFSARAWNRHTEQDVDVYFSFGDDRGPFVTMCPVNKDGETEGEYVFDRDTDVDNLEVASATAIAAYHKAIDNVGRKLES